MGSYKWEIEHNCDVGEVLEVLQGQRFEPSEEKTTETNVLYTYERVINNWKPLQADVKETAVTFSFHWMGHETTEVYYDYLMKSGVYIGIIMSELNAL